MSIYIRSLYIAVALLCVPFTVSASPVVQSADVVTIEAGKEVRGNLYIAGGTVTVSGPVFGDAYIAGGTITINAPIEKDLGIAGGAVRIHADVGDDVRIGAGEVTIDGSVGGDVLVAGGTVHILSTGHVAGDIIVYGGTVTIDGEVEGSLFGTADEVRLNNGIGGSVEFVDVGTLILGAKARIVGDLLYSSSAEARIDEGAQVLGEMTHTQSAPLGIDWVGLALRFMTLLLIVGCVYALLKKQLPDLVARTVKHYAQNALIGIGVLIAMPISAVVLMMTVVAVPLGVFLFALYIVLLIVAFGFTMCVLGSFLMRAFTNRLEVNRFSILAGVVGVWVLMFVPFALMLVLIIPLGVLAREAYMMLLKGLQKKK